MAKSLMLLLALLALCAPAAAEDTKVCGAPVALNDGWTIARAGRASVSTPPSSASSTPSSPSGPRPTSTPSSWCATASWRWSATSAGADERWGDPLGTRAPTAPDVKHDLRSISKSVTSLLVGIARGEGKFPALDSAGHRPFPEYAEPAHADNARITFRDLLTMSSGLAWDEIAALQQSRQQRTRG